ncbi:hypothetical protein [Roseiconus lacunae]|uniref:hypothetical protein n=1 Tax=Roseiconus lacunae TaxID=2605694 RepID=UPI001E349490|nr:hypothetical protein [Roseiconus lacunae]
MNELTGNRGTVHWLTRVDLRERGANGRCFHQNVCADASPISQWKNVSLQLAISQIGFA